MPTIHVEKSDTAEDVARKIRATDQPKVSAESALAAVYAAIEREAKGFDNAGVLSALAELVTALSAFPTGTLLAAGEVSYTEEQKLPQYTEM